MSAHGDGRRRQRAATTVIAAIVAAGAAIVARQAWSPGPLSRPEAVARAQALADLGRRMFLDPSISASGRLACATCHDPAHAFAPAGDRAVQLGGPDMREAGHRAVPSLMYLQAAPPFTEHYFESGDDGDGSADNGPTGGLGWDGRADRARDQARVPLLSPYEMANGSAAGLANRLAHGPYAADLERWFGSEVFAEPERVLTAVGTALEAYQEDVATFAPYSSQYDAYLAGRATLSPPEERGLAAFEDPARGNCARCHPSRPSPIGLPPQFTDYGFAALGVPRNPTIPANADPTFFDLGLCGPDRIDLAQHASDCGRFATPTLRNVATRRVFFHNGVFDSLTEVVEFYAARDVEPARWYPRDAHGRVMTFNDLPARYWPNVETDSPFGEVAGGERRLSPQDVADIVAFLETLTDRGIAHGAPRR